MVKKIFLLEDGEIEEDVKKLIESRAKQNRINNIEVVLTARALSLDNLPFDCDAYIFNLGLIDKSYIEKIIEKNPYVLIYGTGDISKLEKFKKLLNSYNPYIDGTYANFIVDSVKYKNKKFGCFEDE